MNNDLIISFAIAMEIFIFSKNAFENYNLLFWWEKKERKNFQKFQFK